MRINPAIALSLLTALFPLAALAQPHVASEACRPTGAVSGLAGLTEASGLAVSARVPGRLWTHNDAGKPVLVGIDAKGAVTQRVELTGVTVTDWEAIAVGPCPSGSCVYVADIGDNAAKRESISVYRVPEPAAGMQTVAVTEVFRATYPDGPHDAEALLVTPDARLYIVTKGDAGPVGLYRFPADLRAGATVALERVGKAIGSGKPAPDMRITDGSMSPDGRWTVLRSRASLFFYRTSEFVSGNFREEKRVDLKAAGEAQGEGVAYSADRVFLAGEGVGKGLPGTFTHFPCKLNP